MARTTFHAQDEFIQRLLCGAASADALMAFARRDDWCGALLDLVGVMIRTTRQQWVAFAKVYGAASH